MSSPNTNTLKLDSLEFVAPRPREQKLYFSKGHAEKLHAAFRKADGVQSMSKDIHEFSCNNAIISDEALNMDQARSPGGCASGSFSSMKSSGRPTLDEHLNESGLGWYQARLFSMLALTVVADGMEMTVLTMLRAPLMREFGIDKFGFASLGSVIFGGMLIGSLLGERTTIC